jgi:uncharacterized membrane protein YkoI
MVTTMMKKWRIGISIIFVILICCTIVSAATRVSITKYSINQPAAIKLTAARDVTNTIEKPYLIDNFKTYLKILNRQSSDNPGNIRKPDVPGISPAPIMPAISRTSSSATQIGTPYENHDINITEEEAIEIALARFPGIELTFPITASLERIDAPAYPLATNLCWVVELQGQDPQYAGEIHWGYGGIVIIDAVTGEILYVEILC